MTTSPCCPECKITGNYSGCDNYACPCHTEGKEEATSEERANILRVLGTPPQENAVEKPLRIVMPIDLKENVDARKRFAGVPDPSATPTVEEGVTWPDELKEILDTADGNTFLNVCVLTVDLLSQARRSERASLAEKVLSWQIDSKFTWGSSEERYYAGFNKALKAVWEYLST